MLFSNLAEIMLLSASLYQTTVPTGGVSAATNMALGENLFLGELPRLVHVIDFLKLLSEKC